MTNEELSQWKTAERLKRKALKSRERRAEEAVLWKELSAHLKELKQMVKQSKNSSKSAVIVERPGLEKFLPDTVTLFANQTDSTSTRVKGACNTHKEVELIELDSDGNLKFDLNDEEFPILNPVTDEDTSLVRGMNEDAIITPDKAESIELDSDGNLKFDLDDVEFPILNPVTDEDTSLV